MPYYAHIGKRQTVGFDKIETLKAFINKTSKEDEIGCTCLIYDMKWYMSETTGQPTQKLIEEWIVGDPNTHS